MKRQSDLTGEIRYDAIDSTFDHAEIIGIYDRGSASSLVKGDMS